MIMVFTPNPRFGDTCRHPKKCSKQESKITQGTSFSFGHTPKASTKGWLSFSRTTGFEAVSSPWLSMLTMVGNPTQKNCLAKFLLPLIPNGLHGQEVNRLRMYIQLIEKKHRQTLAVPHHQSNAQAEAGGSTSSIVKRPLAGCIRSSWAIKGVWWMSFRYICIFTHHEFVKILEKNN